MATSMFIKYNNDNQYVLGYYDHEHELVKAVKALLGSGHKIHNVITPFPVHGLDDAMAIKQTKLPWLVLVMGISEGAGSSQNTSNFRCTRITFLRASIDRRINFTAVMSWGEMFNCSASSLRCIEGSSA